MDIHSAELHIQKVNQYLSEVLESDPRMYAKTRDKFSQLSSEMFKGIDTISKILVDSSLVDEQEFDPESQSNEALHTLRQQSANSLISITRAEDFVSKPTSNMSPSKRKYVAAKYGAVFRRLSQSVTPYPIVNDCSKMLWKWYNARFFSPSPLFHYNIRRFPEWVRGIVIAYGNSVKENKSAEFTAKFYSWLDSVSAGQENKYAVPYDIYQVTQSVNASQVSIEAIMIWEVLLDVGLNELTVEELDECKLNSETIYNMFAEVDPTVVDRYVYYRDDDSLIRRMK